MHTHIYADIHIHTRVISLSLSFSLFLLSYLFIYLPFLIVLFLCQDEAVRNNHNQVAEDLLVAGANEHKIDCVYN